jgi:hypothetical protein
MGPNTKKLVAFRPVKLTLVYADDAASAGIRTGILAQMAPRKVYFFLPIKWQKRKHDLWEETRRNPPLITLKRAG